MLCFLILSAGIVQASSLVGREFSLHTDKLTWIEANNACQKEGSTLARVEDFSTAYDLGLIKRDIGSEAIWIGYHRDMHSATWVWVNDTTGGWTNWTPKSSGDPQCCCAGIQAEIPYQWDGFDCTLRHAYLCYKPIGNCQVFDSYVGIRIGGNGKKSTSANQIDCNGDCYQESDFVCMSASYNAESNECEMYSGNAWSQVDDVTTNNEAWAYAHRRCNSDKINGALTLVDVVNTINKLRLWNKGQLATQQRKDDSNCSWSSSSSDNISNGSGQPNRTASDLTKRSAGDSQQSTVDTCNKTYEEACVRTPISDEDAEMLNETIVAFSQITTIYKEKKRHLTKVSIADSRSISLYIGLTSVGVAIAFLLTFILMDIAYLPISLRDVGFCLDEEKPRPNRPVISDPIQLGVRHLVIGAGSKAVEGEIIAHPVPDEITWDNVVDSDKNDVTAIGCITPDSIANNESINEDPPSPGPGQADARVASLSKLCTTMGAVPKLTTFKLPDDRFIEGGSKFTRELTFENNSYGSNVGAITDGKHDSNATNSVDEPTFIPNPPPIGNMGKAVSIINVTTCTSP